MTFFGLFLLFFKIGVFTFGGGYAMIPLFFDELVTGRGLLTQPEFANLLSLAQMTPGPVGMNAATYAGFRQLGVWGAVAGTLGVMAPSLTLVLLVGIFMNRFQTNTYVRAVLDGIRPGTIGLVAAAVIFFAESSILRAPLQSLWTGEGKFGISLFGAAAFCFTFMVSKYLKWNILWIFLVTGSVGAALGYWGLI
ncbi:MAG: chromate transporter [Victivallaceae bacterium]|nr:chromate transporter [Victivallaceae bacterium]